jgi:hypothetical protein
LKWTNYQFKNRFAAERHVSDGTVAIRVSFGVVCPPLLHQQLHQLIKHVSCPTGLLLAAPINQKSVFGQHSMRVMDLQLQGVSFGVVWPPVLHQHLHQLIKHVSCPTDLLVAAPINQKSVCGQDSMRMMDLQLKG